LDYRRENQLDCICNQFFGNLCRIPFKKLFFMKYKFTCCCGNIWEETDENIKGKMFLTCPKCKESRKNPIKEQTKLEK